MMIVQPKEASTSKAIRDHGLGGVGASIDNGMCFKIKIPLKMLPQSKVILFSIRFRRLKQLRLGDEFESFCKYNESIGRNCEEYEHRFAQIATHEGITIHR